MGREGWRNVKTKEYEERVSYVIRIVCDMGKSQDLILGKNIDLSR